MIIEKKYTKKFESNSLTRTKYNELYDMAVYLLDCRNKISIEVFQNIDHYIKLGRYDFEKEIKSKNICDIPNVFIHQVCEQVRTSYINRYDFISKSIEFETKVFKGFSHYKKNTKYHNAGDFKKVLFEKNKTELSICLTYLARYGYDNTVEHIKNNISNNIKVNFFKSIYNVILKYGFERLYKLAKSKRDRIIKLYNSTPIIFTSLTIFGRSRKVNFVKYNKNYNSIIKAFIGLTWPNKSLYIPVKISKKYHGKLSSYKKNSNDYEYTITFNERHKSISINILNSKIITIPDVDLSNIIGIDVNIKNNLFALSDGSYYDCDRRLLNDYINFCKSINNINNNNKWYNIGKRKQYKFQAIKRKIKASNENIIIDMCKHLRENNITHIVMEDLRNTFGKTKAKYNNVNFNEISHLLNISDLKNVVKRIALKYGITTSFIDPSYTSQMCPICGCIDDENRQDQEHFHCIECDHEDNADHNAAVNIKNRVFVTVLRDRLLKQSDDKTFIPKSTKRENVKKVLLSCYTKDVFIL